MKTRISLYLSLCLVFVAQIVVHGEPPEKLNIIYILADDLGYADVSFNGQEKFTTPHLDRLANDGMVFNQHYSGSTVCAPSRSTLMTGQHTGRTPIRHNSKGPAGGQLPLPAGTVTVAKVLQEAGYVTGAFGKWGLGYTGSEGDPSRQGFDVFYGYKDQVNAHHYYPQILWDNNTKVQLNSKGKQEVYAPFRIQEETLKFIRENKDRPFFCYVPSVLPHAELVAPEAYIARFRGNFGEETPYDAKKGSRKTGYGSQADPKAAFAAMVQILDEQVGEIRALVEELGIAERTIIIFTSDNGPHDAGGADPEYFDSNGPFRGIKRDLYEGGIRVPMVAWAPDRVDAGSETDHVSAFWDVLPTLAELAGAPVPDDIDGLSFAPILLQNGNQSSHQYLYWEFLGGGGKLAVRMGNWKAVQLGVSKNPDGPIQLFDLPTDPEESIDLAAEYPELVEQARQVMQEAHAKPLYAKFNFLPGDDAKDALFLYRKGPLKLSADAIHDAVGSISLDQLPTPKPQIGVKLKPATTPFTQRMWAIALDDIERNIVLTDDIRYFGAGSRYGNRVYTRDIALTGVLGANFFYPKIMKDSLVLTRKIRRELGYKVSQNKDKDHVVEEIKVPWEVIAESDKEIMAKYRTNSYTRRTDDVVWLWAADDLFTKHPELADWNWLYTVGEEFFKDFYDPWFDSSDGLYRGQPIFQDLTSSAYPKHLTIADCVLMKAASTNALYYRGMLAMAHAATMSSQEPEQKVKWLKRAEALKAAFQNEFLLEGGEVTYYKDRYGELSPHQHNLGTAFAVMFGILEGPDAKRAYANYPTHDRGVPLIHPFLPDNKGPHNAATWPFCSTFFLWGKEVATGKSLVDYNAALLGRSLGTKMAEKSKKIAANEEDWDAGLGSFHEKIQLPSGLIDGSGHQLWSAAAFLNVCIRAGIIFDSDKAFN
ncbi:sulfatase-like hydrolase/transferase [Puniceicoccales bacterium CK1056]|uniref:Sulfatase-like hydrolase/transferase n=1 Tax=Oceanipulchritudo coccoides TaxID=2706888 RepID=A0A6B2LXZ6_9BACT|nr:sulfatase-like hydrolase/transferase [Oceanipulchritudo coccoides]NDV60992.1 sulfatase-like hydrolase/transferase [Oceanipulchritudo coccoides]